MHGDCTIRVHIPDEPGAMLQLHLGATVTIHAVKQLYDTACELTRQPRDLQICCDEAEYLDVAAVQVILALGRKLQMQNRVCELTGIRNSVRKDLIRIGLGHLLPSEDTPS